MNVTTESRFRGCLLGLACGDAVGTTVEFQPRGTFEPISDMVGGGPFRLEPGQWTDDTSLALCLGESLIECKGFDPRDQMLRYVRWMREGHLASNGRCFDIGFTTSTALTCFEETGDAFAGDRNPEGAGNGSLMRLAPVPMWFAPDREAAIHYAGQSSRTTHGAPEAIDACRYYASLLVGALTGEEPKPPGKLVPKIAEIASGTYRDKGPREIHGSGYVVNSLEAALWCFHVTDNFRDAILAAVNLGDDADTTAAVCGQLAGATYGEEAIPPEWRERVAMRDRIVGMADALRLRA